MGGIVVVDLVLAVVTVVVVLWQIGFRRVGRGCKAVALVPAQRNGERAEAALAGRVVNGELTGAAYHERMAELAAADQLRHPLNVPLD